jgi:tRNA-splicing endonuclease subunit Sen2
MPAPSSRVKWKRGKRRVAHRHKRPDQLIHELVRDHCGMWGTLARGQVWIGATRRQAYLLEQTCLGRRARSGAERGVPLTPNGTGIELVVRVCCEDAYYMSAILGVLRVSEAVEGREMEVRLGTGTCELDARALWKKFRRECGHAFAMKCAATIHFRLTGWLPRSGLQYGADFVLYQRHPALVHSDSTVTLVPDAAARESFKVDATANRDVALEHGWPDWPDVQATSRLAVQVNKKFIEAHISAPKNVDWDDPSCLSHVWVNETSVARFNALRHLDAYESK